MGGKALKSIISSRRTTDELLRIYESVASKLRTECLLEVQLIKYYSKKKNAW